MKYGLMILSLAGTVNLTLAAAYPELMWLDTDIDTTNRVEVARFDIPASYFRASAIKNTCALGGTLGCSLQ